MYRVVVITASDAGYAGRREDESGPMVAQIMAEAGYEVVSRRILPDERAMLGDAMREVCDGGAADLILTTGGTGFSARDVTPEATMDVAQRMVPGIPEAMRALSLAVTPNAMLSRAAAGIRGRTLIINLPGSPKAVRECLAFILPAVAHGLDILTENATNCAR